MKSLNSSLKAALLKIYYVHNIFLCLIIYSHEGIERMVGLLDFLPRVSQEEKQQHIEDLQTKCPYCGKPLVLRNGKYGQFWGCSAYPKCRFTRKAE